MNFDFGELGIAAVLLEAVRQGCLALAVDKDGLTAVCDRQRLHH
jgi:hypothetical protein